MRNLLLAAAVLLAGCDASTFNSVNATVVSTRQVSAQASNVALPAAAIAGGLGAVELIKALAAGSAPTATTSSRNAHLLALTALGSGDQDVVDADAKVKMHLRYVGSTAADGTVSASVTSFTGTAQGYAVDAHGDFTYTPDGQVTCTMAGSMGYGDSAFTVKELKLATAYPLPPGSELGSCTFQQTEAGIVKAELTAKLTTDANGQIALSGDVTHDGKTTALTNFGQRTLTAGS